MTTAVTVPETTDFAGEGALHGVPVPGLLDADAGELVVALGVAALDGDGELVADADGGAGVGEEVEGEDALGFEADVDEDGVGGEGDDGAADPLSTLHRACVAALEGEELVAKGLGGFDRFGRGLLR